MSVLTLMPLQVSVVYCLSEINFVSYVASASQPQNISTTVYVVACSLDVSNYTSGLEVQNGSLGPTMNQPAAPSQAWSLWTPTTNGSGTQLNKMVRMSLCLRNYIIDVAEITMGIGGHRI